jgi:exodeoxyribonuclease VII large subunit
LGELSARLAAVHPGAALQRARRAIDQLATRRDHAASRALANRRSELARLGGQMSALSPLAVLERGYAVVRAGAEIIRDAATVGPGTRLHVRVARGELEVEVVDPDREPSR